MAYLIVLTLAAIFQRELLYFPTRSNITPEQAGLAGTQAVTFAADDSTKLTAWYRPPAEGKPLLVYFHGNGGDISYRAGRLSQFAEAGLGYLILSYRGYGASEGSPTEAGLYLDAKAAIDYATQTHAIPLSSIVLYGESLGTGVAVEMATRYPVAAVMLEAPYTSVATRAAEMYFWLPVRLVIRDHYDSISKISNIQSPLLLIHGERDGLIPIEHGKALFAAAPSPKKAHYLPDVGHNDFDAAWIASSLLDFLGEHPPK